MLRETICVGGRKIHGISARCHYHLEELAKRRIVFNVENSDHVQVRLRAIAAQSTFHERILVSQSFRER